MGHFARDKDQIRLVVARLFFFFVLSLVGTRRPGFDGRVIPILDSCSWRSCIHTDRIGRGVFGPGFAGTSLLLSAYCLEVIGQVSNGDGS